MNTPVHFPVTFNSGDDTMYIKGFGNFHQDQILNAECQRFKAARLEKMAVTAPTAAELGVTGTNVPVTFSIVVKTTRDQSEFAIDFIVKGRPIVFEIYVSTGETSSQVGATMQSAITEWAKKFTYATLPFSSTHTSGVLTLTAGNFSYFFRNRVEFKVNRVITPIVAVTTKFFDTTLNTGTGATSTTVPMASTTGLLVGDTVRIGTTLAAGEERLITAIVTDTSITVNESLTFATADNVYLENKSLAPTFDGKYLEENARMSLWTTSDSYGISPDEKPIIAGEYATVSFTMKESATYGIDRSHKRHAFLGNTRGEVGGEREFKFTLYLLESASMWTASAGNKAFDIVDFLDDSAITPVLRIANGSIAANAAAWVA